MRIETGSVQFGRDWPGVFIRGDTALSYVFELRKILEELKKSGALISSNGCDKFDPSYIHIAIPRGFAPAKDGWLVFIPEE